MYDRNKINTHGKIKKNVFFLYDRNKMHKVHMVDVFYLYDRKHFHIVIVSLAVIV